MMGSATNFLRMARSKSVYTLRSWASSTLKTGISTDKGHTRVYVP